MAGPKGLPDWICFRKARGLDRRHPVMLLQVVVSPRLPSVPIRVLPAAAVDSQPGIAPQLPAARTFPELSRSNGRPHAFTWRQIVVGVYAAVAVVLFARLMIGYCFTRRLVRHSRSTDVLPASRVARLHESEWISVPMTVGQIAPTILLPPGWREWDAAKLRAVLVHEEAHVRRADWAIGVMARINCCVFWFHPQAWWLKRELATLAEFACDDFVLAQMEDRQQYARALLEIACAMKSAHGRLLEDAMSMARETNVRKRMDQILDETRQIPPAFGRPAWMTLLVCGLPLAYLASTVELTPAQTKTVVTVDQPSRQQAPAPVAPAKKKPVQLIAQAKSAPPAPSNAVPAPAPNPYRKWIDEEVRFIISDEERRAFNRLASDEERQQFVLQFWLRRDPTPDTPENEMQEEHYRRIAFANDHFSVGIPGWKTDRGMIYIKYGPPEAIDSHGATPLTYPYEIWRYPDAGFGPAEFEFVDPTMTGRYHLTQDPSEKDIRQ